MKKALFVLLIVLTLGSCKNEFDDVVYTINNNTKATDITFDFNNNTITLQPKPEEPDEITVYTVKYTINSGKGNFKPSNFDFSGHPASIRMSTVNRGRAGMEFNFVDVKRYNLHVLNTFPSTITISADNFIDYNDSTEITIGAGEEITDAKIYTNKPVFSTTSDYKVNFDQEFKTKTEIDAETEAEIVIETVYLVIR